VGTGAHERAGALGDGLGLSPRARLGFLVLAMVALVTGIAGGLARLGVAVPAGAAAAFHGALMVSGFLGTVISLERAVALGSPLAYSAPLVSGAGTLLLLAGAHAAGFALWVAAPVLLFAASVAIARRQPALHTILLAVAALAWCAGSLCFALGSPGAAPAWWFAFLVLTICAERLEMTRLTRRPRIAVPLFLALVACLVVGAAVSPIAFGVASIGLAAWLAAFDIARHTVRANGFPRYAALALIGGYVWLAAGGAAWAFAPSHRDLALHALGLGFVFSMIMAHAPLVVPAVLRLRVAFTPFAYVALALLHASLAVRLIAGAEDASLRAAGAVLNAAAIVVFAATLAWSARRSASVARGA
jgi:hypothetical protein